MLGHGILYHQIDENYTTFCLKKIASAANERLIIPKAIHPNVFTNLLWDNIDRLEATVPGCGTPYRVNGSAVQPNVLGP